MKFKGLFKRNFLEIIRDPLTLLLGLAMPAAFLVIFVLINKFATVQIPTFSVANLTPGMVVFGFSFLMMFTAMLIAQDRNSSMFARFQTLPLRSIDFILGYSLPFLPLALIQIVLTYALGLLMGLPFSWGILISIPFMLPVAFVFIALGLIMGCYCSNTQISGIGTVLINVFTILSGAWFDLEWMGTIKTIAYTMPFARAVSGTRELLAGSAFDMSHIWVILAYMVVFVVLSIFVFNNKINNKQYKKIIKK